MPSSGMRALLILGAVWAVPLAAQDSGPNATPAALRTEYLTNMKEVEEKVIGLAEAFPADKYGWRPGLLIRNRCSKGPTPC